MLNYELVSADTFTLPAGALQFDIAGDGRLVLVGAGSLWIETASGSRNFTQHSVAGISASTSLVRVSPDGGRLAVGIYGNDSSNQQVRKVLVFSFPSLATLQASFGVAAFDAEWIDANSLLVSGEGADGMQPPSVVWYLHVPTATQKLLIKEIDGNSAGVTLDADNNAYTANGHGPTPQHTGLIKAFAPGAWRAAAISGQPLDFRTDGVVVAELLSAAPLGFDEQGNFFCGGGDFAGAAAEKGYVAVASRDTLRRALHGGQIINSQVMLPRLQKLDPDQANLNNFYTVNHNLVRRELYLQDLSNSTISVYKQRLLHNSITVNVHLGDTPSAFPGSTFVGMAYQTSLAIPDPQSFAGTLCLRLEAEHVETLGGAQHRVRVNGVDVGSISDTILQNHETFDFYISHADAQSIFQIANPATLRIDVDGSVGSGLADDFVIHRIGTIVVPN